MVDPEAFQRAIGLHQRGQLEAAEQAYRGILAAEPGHFGATHLLGVLFLQRGQAELAERQIGRALELKPDSAEALANRGNALKTLNRMEEAFDSYSRALALKPEMAEALVQRGIVLESLRQPDAALQDYDRALALKPQAPVALANRGRILYTLRRFEEALPNFDKAIALQPGEAGLHFARANTLAELVRFEEARAGFDRAIALSPDYAEALRNRGILRLLFGDFAGGLADYEHRRPRDQAQRMLPQVEAPYWSGEDPDGRSILVSDATGMGDAIHFVRYLPMLAARGARVSFMGNTKLYRLFATLAPGVRFLDAVATDERFDFQCKLLSLPFLFHTELATIPGSVPYLRAESPLLDKWRARIGAEGFKIGICWKGNPSRTIDAGRSIPLAGFEAIAQIAGVRLISLQKRYGLDELQRLPASMRIETLGEDFDEGSDAFLDSAAAMQQLDLVITSDTSLAHLAGALGRPTWVALKLVPEWRWLLDREDSPWYPTMRLFRQTRRDDWGAVFDAMALRLHSLVDGAGRS